MRNPLEKKKKKKLKSFEKKEKGKQVKRTSENQRSSHKWNWKYVSKFKREKKEKKSLKWEKKMELPHIKMKKKSNVKNPTSIIPSLKTLKITLSNHRANPQKSLKWRSLQKG